MKLKVIVHKAEEEGCWAEVPAIPGCATQGRTFDELLNNVHEAVEGCLSVDVSDGSLSSTSIRGDAPLAPVEEIREAVREYLQEKRVSE